MTVRKLLVIQYIAENDNIENKYQGWYVYLILYMYEHTYVCTGVCISVCYSQKQLNGWLHSLITPVISKAK